jgi:hypothetical protein
MHAWHGIIVVLTSLSLLMGCASSPYVGTGAALGGGLGALAGAAIGHKNPWAGAAIGGLAGAGAGALTGYALQQRQAQPPQGYYYQQPPPAYGAPPPRPNYGPNYGYNYPPPAPGRPTYSSAPPVENNYSQLTPPQPEGCRVPMKYVPYYY